MPLYTVQAGGWSQCGREGFAFVPGGSNSLINATQVVQSFPRAGDTRSSRDICASHLPGYPYLCFLVGGPPSSVFTDPINCTWTSVAWPGATSFGHPDRAHRNCEQTPCDGGSTDGFDASAVWECECWYCGTGNAVYNPATGNCYVCPAGMCYCTSVGDCVNCTAPPCSAQLSCYWDPAGCAYSCSTPTCPSGKTWNSTHCDCEVPTTPPPPPPPCADVLHCTLNTTTNSWDCDLIPDCPLGTIWSDTDCACGPRCLDPGTCWCDHDHVCVTCPPLLCSDELLCTWNMLTCLWDCDEPPPCDPGQSWSYATCSCVGEGEGLATLHDKQGRYYRAVPETSGIQMYRAPKQEPPFTLAVLATTDAADNDPALFQDDQQRLHILFSRGADILETISADFANTWSTPVAMFSTGSTRPRSRIHSRSLIRIRSAYNGGHIVGRRQDPNGTIGAEFTFVLVGGGSLTVDDSPYDLSPSPLELHEWVLEARQSGALHSWRSFNNCKTWELIL